MIYHIVTGDFAAAPLKEAILQEPSMAGETIVIKDVLSVGPIKRNEGQKFSELRTLYWQQVIINEREKIFVDDIDRLIRTGNELQKSEAPVIWIWMAPWPADVATYYWAVKYLAKFPGRIYVVNIAGLPFLDDKGKLYFPQSISEILPRELIKARKLARLITLSEFETDSYEWDRLTEENAGVRILDGSRRLKSVNENFYDAQLLSCCTDQYQKAVKVVGQAIAKYQIPPGDLFLGWRLRKLAEDGKVKFLGDYAKGLKDFEVKLADDTLF